MPCYPNITALESGEATGKVCNFSLQYAFSCFRASYDNTWAKDHLRNTVHRLRARPRDELIAACNRLVAQTGIQEPGEAMQAIRNATNRRDHMWLHRPHLPLLLQDDPHVCMHGPQRHREAFHAIASKQYFSGYNWMCPICKSKQREWV